MPGTNGVAAAAIRIGSGCMSQYSPFRGPPSTSGGPKMAAVDPTRGPACGALDREPGALAAVVEARDRLVLRALVEVHGLGAGACGEAAQAAGDGADHCGVPPFGPSLVSTIIAIIPKTNR